MLVHDHVVIKAGVRAVQGKPEAVLAGRRAVARGRVAALGGKDRKQVALEADSHGRAPVPDLDRRHSRSIGAAHVDSSLPRSVRHDAVSFNRGHSWIRAGCLAARSSGQHDALGFARTLERDIGGLDQDCGRCRPSRHGCADARFRIVPSAHCKRSRWKCLPQPLRPSDRSGPGCPCGT